MSTGVRIGLIRWEVDRDETPDRMHGHAGRNRAGVMRCHTCDQELVDILLAYQTVTVHDDEGQEEREEVAGRRASGRPGVVDAPRRHPTGHRWYVVRGAEAERRMPLRLPAVVSCAKGHDNLLA